MNPCATPNASVAFGSPCTKVFAIALAVMLSVIAVLGFSAITEAMQPDQAFADNPKTAISKKAKTLYKGQHLQLTMKGAAGKVTWKSSKKSVATVTSAGVVYAKEPGKATITAKVGGATYKCKVTVKTASKSKRAALAKSMAKKVVKSLIKPGMNKMARAYVLGNYLTCTTTRQTNQSNKAYKSNYGNEAYAALVMGKAACSGYCKAYTLLCKQAGVTVRHINANKWTHQWNEVKVDGKWYMVDTQGGFSNLDLDKVPASVTDQYEQAVCAYCGKAYPLRTEKEHYKTCHNRGGHLIGFDNCKVCRDFCAKFESLKNYS